MPTIFIASLAAISANNWFVLWLFLEINLLCFVPIIIADRSNQTTEARVKYFLAQATGSIILLAAAISMSTQTYISPSFRTVLLISSLALKLGIPPAHTWFPGVIAAISWPNCLLLSTWQKIVPLFILTLSPAQNTILLLFLLAALATLVGGIGGLNQTQLRPLLAYRRMGHIGWMLAVSPFSSNTVLIYFITYVVISAPLILLLHGAGFSSKSLSSSIISLPKSILLPTTVLLLSLGGLPPLLGFFPKWIVMQDLATAGNYLIAFPLILGSLMNLFYYLRIVFSISIADTAQPDPLQPAPTVRILASLIFSLPVAPLAIFLTIYALTFLNQS